MLDRLLRGERLDFIGQYYRAEGEPLATPVQRPRLPLVVAAEAKGSLRLAARFADVWTSLGGQHQTVSGRAHLPIDEAVARTREQSHRASQRPTGEKEDALLLARGRRSGQYAHP